ncbi:L domain-like protein [Neocallimastix sp. 'constans']
MDLTSTFTPKFFELKNLIHLSLANNKISGEIPDEFSKLPNLIDLSLRNNKFTGNIPDLSSLSNLRNLFLQNNQFSGEIGNKLKNLNNLEDLYLSSNQLKGEIPEYIGSYTNMINITLSDNQFSGSIPSSFGNFKNLTHIDADNLNQIKGPVPKFTSQECSFTGTDVCYKVGEQISCASSLRICTDKDLKIIKPSNSESPKIINTEKKPENSNTLLYVGIIEPQNIYNNSTTNPTLSGIPIFVEQPNIININTDSSIIQNPQAQNMIVPNVHQSYNDIYIDKKQYLSTIQYNNQLLNCYYNTTNTNYMNGNNYSNVQSSPIMQDITLMNMNMSNNNYNQGLSSQGSPVIYSPISLSINSQNNIPAISLYSDNQSVSSSNNTNSVYGNDDRSPQPSNLSLQRIQRFSGVSFENNEIPNEDPPPYV